uniref:Uncharacterized protein n=1 Tax=Burkholderia phage vB_BgluM-SURPRISE13 TaxID=3159457 RepID=A0AAU7PFH0_9VIRU
MDKNKLIEELAVNSTGIGFPVSDETKPIREALDFEDRLKKMIHSGMGLPPALIEGVMTEATANTVKANIRYMRMGLKVLRCLQKKFSTSYPIDFRRAVRQLNATMRETKNIVYFEKQLSNWMRSSIIDPQEYWSQVVSNPRFHRTFVEQRFGNWVSSDGWVILKEQIDSEEIWSLEDPTGRIHAELPYRYKFEEDYPYQLISYQDRYGRHGDTECDIKYGPAHFPEGTVVRVNPEHKDHLGNNEFTVDHIVVIGARNYLLVMKEIKPGVPGSAILKDEPRQYNMHHVWKIVKRGDGKVDLRDDHPEYEPIDLGLLSQQSHQLIVEYIREEGFTMPKLNKGETLFGSTGRLLSAIQQRLGIAADHKAKWIDDSKFHHHMKVVGFGRFVSVFNPVTMNHDSFYAINVKKMVKFMQKYPDRLFMTLRHVEKEEAEMDRKQSEELSASLDW